MHLIIVHEPIRQNMVDGLGVRQDRKPDIESLTEASQIPFDPGNRTGMNTNCAVAASGVTLAI
jgi:hypothetical protein